MVLLVAGQSTTSTTVAPTTTIAPMTAEELAWLNAVTRQRKKINKVFSATGEVYITRREDEGVYEHPSQLQS